MSDQGIRRANASTVAVVVVLLAYVAVLLTTASTYPGDTRDYADSIAAHFQGRDLNFWEFGHLIWRPVGYLAVLSTQWLRASSAPHPLYIAAVHSLVAISITAGAIALVAFVAWMIRLRVPTQLAIATTIAMMLSCTLLNYAQTGTSYVPAFAMLCLSLWAVMRADELRNARKWMPALPLALTTLFWLPMVLVIPAVCAAPPTLLENTPERRRTAYRTFGLTTGLVLAAYASAMLIKGIHSAAAFNAWISAASHGIRDSGGVTRATVGFARSVVSSEQLGLAAKRYLLADPFNPSTAGDVLRGGLWRLGLFYLAGLAAIILLARRDAVGRKALVFFALSAVPVLTLAVMWQGGDLERYLALLPALYLTAAFALSSLTPRHRVAGEVALVVCICLLNVPDFLRGKSELLCADQLRRISAIPEDPGLKALVITPLKSDEITQLAGLCPNSPLLRTPTSPYVVGLVTPHETSAPAWRSYFASMVTTAWHSGRRVWLSKRAFAARPAPQWAWVEGDEPRVHWKDFPEFFRKFEYRDADPRSSFVELLPSTVNVAIVDGVSGPIAPRPGLVAVNSAKR